MRTLVLCLDRDDDIGRKAGIASPVIGRSANIEAATKLAVADPEDSDINTIFGGIQEYDRLSAAGTDVEIVCIAGDRDVGVVSDNKIALQIDDLLGKGEFGNVIFISDGAEDESVLPIIESRIKINSVKRIRVKQSESIGLAFIVYAASVVAEQPGLAVAGILGVVGTYLLYTGFGVGSSIGRYRETATESLYRGKISFITYIAAIIIGIIATIQGANACWEGITGDIFPGYVILSMIFVQASVWWYVASGLFLGFGKIVDLRLEGRAIGRAWAFPFFVIAAGLLLWAASAYILTTTEYQQGYGIQHLILSIVGPAATRSLTQRHPILIACAKNTRHASCRRQARRSGFRMGRWVTLR